LSTLYFRSVIPYKHHENTQFTGFTGGKRRTTIKKSRHPPACNLATIPHTHTHKCNGRTVQSLANNRQKGKMCHASNIPKRQGPRRGASKGKRIIRAKVASNGTWIPPLRNPLSLPEWHFRGQHQRSGAPLPCIFERRARAHHTCIYIAVMGETRGESHVCVFLVAWSVG
jgi:hypothetical protein